MYMKNLLFPAYVIFNAIMSLELGCMCCVCKRGREGASVL